MNEIIRNSELLTVITQRDPSVMDSTASDFNQLVNVNSLTVNKIKYFLRQVSACMNKDSSRVNRAGPEYTNIIPYFRGFTPEYNGNSESDFYKKIFIVGEKGPAYREDIFQMGIDGYYRGNITKKKIEDTIEEINTILHGKNKNTLKKDEVYKIIESNDMSDEDMYVLLLNFLHNIGGRWENKERSPYVSASHGNDALNKATDFASGREHKKVYYILWGFIQKNDKRNYFLTSEMTDIIRELDVDWYSDVHSEIILKDAILPQKMIGIFKIDERSNTTQFIINPYLYQLFKSNKRNSADIFNYISKEGIPVNQAQFDEFANDLGYISYAYDDGSKYRRAGTIGNSAEIILPNNYLIE